MLISSACLDCINSHCSGTVTQPLEPTSEAVLEEARIDANTSAAAVAAATANDLALQLQWHATLPLFMHTIECWCKEVARHFWCWAIVLGPGIAVGAR